MAVETRTRGSVKHGDVQSEYFLRNAGQPASGTSGTFAGEARPFAELFDTTNGGRYVNEGTLASPYWTPIGYDQPSLLAYHTEFADGVGKAVADTATGVALASGWRVHGQGVADTDSGAVAQAAAEGVRGDMRLTTTNEVAHTIALSAPAGIYQPDQHGILTLDVELSNVSAITLRALFMGFLGTAADALDPPVTGATTTLTLVQDDLAGLFFDVGLTDGDRLFAPHNKSNEAATLATTATGVDTGSDIAAAGTFQRFRIEISAAGVMTCFVDKAQVTQISASLDADEETTPSICLESTSTAVKSMDVRRASAWALRA